MSKAKKEVEEVPSIYNYAYKMGMIKAMLQAWKAGYPSKKALERIYKIVFSESSKQEDV